MDSGRCLHFNILIWGDIITLGSGNLIRITEGAATSSVLVRKRQTRPYNWGSGNLVSITEGAAASSVLLRERQPRPYYWGSGKLVRGRSVATNKAMLTLSNCANYWTMCYISQDNQLAGLFQNSKH